MFGHAITNCMTLLRQFFPSTTCNSPHSFSSKIENIANIAILIVLI